ncbi:MAG: baseplate J/gp47 family protein [Deltaproteobacteria bacterium]|nr:baseplate J/gp47 family protein [Myxococcales bacterium]MDP3219932.1 baseplate J/gp47 family protein [Deltaproteobacteria bacterium]
MTVTSVYEILVAKTEDELIDEQLADMAAADPPLPVTAWQPGDVALTLVETDAGALADVHQTVGQLGAAAFLSTAAALADGRWLTLRAKSTFNLDRILATFTTGTGTLTNAAGAGPHTIAPGALVIATAAGLRYRSTNTANVIVPLGGSVAITLRAEGSGTAYNRTGGELSVLVTPANAGMSFAAASGTAWITASARDEESNAALVTRCRARWATLAVAGCGTREAYTFNILSATMDGTATGTSCGVTRVGFLAPPGDGTVPIVIAGATGLLTDGQRDAVRAYINTRRGITDAPGINHATPVSVNPVGTVTFKAGLNTAGNQLLVETAISAYINALPMGDDLSSGFVDQAQVFAAILAAVPGGFVDVDLSAPTDTTIGEGEVAVVTSFAGLTYA